MFRGIAERTGPYLSTVLLRNPARADYVRLCGNIISIIGLALILAAVFALDSRDFPGYKALLPVMGAVLMIAAGKDAFLNRCLLSNRVMVWFGLISYPLYIWHWPFLSFAWIVGGEMPQLKVRIGCVVLAVIMSAVTYYFVEPGLRWGRYGGYKAAGLLSVMVTVGIAGYSVERHDGYTTRMNDPEQQVIDAINSRLKKDNERCLKEIPDWNRLSEARDFFYCKFQRSSGKNTIAIIGDSHAGHLYDGLTAHAREDEGIVLFAVAGGVPLIGLHSVVSPEALKWSPNRVYTDHLMSEAWKYILTHKNITKVILSHRPSVYWHIITDIRNQKNHDFDSILHDGFVRTYEALTKAGKEIYVVSDNPNFNQDNYLKCKASVVRRPYPLPAFLLSKNEKICSISQTERTDKMASDNWNSVSLEFAVGYNNIHFIDMAQPFCKHGICSMLDGRGNILYLDENHINIKGAMYASPLIFNELRR